MSGDPSAVPDTHHDFILCQLAHLLKPLYRVANVSNRSGIKYPRLRIFASKQNVNDINLYNNYTFFGFPGLLIFQILLAVSLSVSCALAVEALSFILGSALRVALGAGLTGALALLWLAFLFESGGFIHKQHLLAIFPQSSFRCF